MGLKTFSVQDYISAFEALDTDEQLQIVAAVNAGVLKQANTTDLTLSDSEKLQKLHTLHWQGQSCEELIDLVDGARTVMGPPPSMDF